MSIDGARMNPNDDTQRGRLQKAIETSYRGLEWVRNLKRGLVESYAGSGYGRPNKPRRETVINLPMQTVEAYTMALVANRPRVLVTARNPARAFFAKKFTAAINTYIEQIGLEFTLRSWVLDAFFGLGVVKLHLADSGLVQLETDRWMDPGKPFASNVSLDNFVYDLASTRWEQVRFAGDSYKIPFSELDHPMFFPDVAQDLVPSKNASDDDRVERLSRGETVDDDDLEPMIDLADIWIPRDGMVYTFPVDSQRQFQIKSKPVAAMPWDGTERGPYPILGFNDVPDNIIPTSMAAQLQTLDRLINNLLRKQTRQAMRQKDITTYTPAGKEDAQRVQRTDDGGMIQVNDISQIGQLKMGGIDATNQAFAVSAIQMYDRMAGNLTAMLGLGAQAPTASQEQMIQGKISTKEAAMQYRVLDASSRLIRDLGFMLWHDKAQIIDGRIPLEGADGYSVDGTWRPDDREGSFFDYDLNVDVYSMAYQSPAQRWNTVTQFVTQIYAPLAQQFAAQGGQLNLQNLTDLAAEMLNAPQLKDCIQFANPLPNDERAAEDSARPASTTRNYTRQSISGGPTPQNAANQQAQQWLKMDSQKTGAIRGAPA